MGYSSWEESKINMSEEVFETGIQNLLRMDERKNVNGQILAMEQTLETHVS